MFTDAFAAETNAERSSNAAPTAGIVVAFVSPNVPYNIPGSLLMIIAPIPPEFSQFKTLSWKLITPRSMTQIEPFAAPSTDSAVPMKYTDPDAVPLFSIAEVGYPTPSAVILAIEAIPAG